MDVDFVVIIEFLIYLVMELLCCMLFIFIIVGLVVGDGGFFVFNWFCFRIVIGVVLLFLFVVVV